MVITGEPFDLFFWNFAWSWKSVKVKKWQIRIFGENYGFAQIGPKYPKNGPFQLYFKFQSLLLAENVLWRRLNTLPLQMLIEWRKQISINSKKINSLKTGTCDVLLDIIQLLHGFVIQDISNVADKLYVHWYYELQNLFNNHFEGLSFIYGCYMSFVK